MHLLPELASHHAVSIPELLVSRDERQARQHVWLKRHPVPLVSFTVVAPGPIKVTGRSEVDDLGKPYPLLNLAYVGE